MNNLQKQKYFRIPPQSAFKPIESQSFDFKFDNINYNLILESNGNYFHFALNDKEKSDSNSYEYIYNTFEIQTLFDITNKNIFEKVSKIFKNCIDNYEANLIKHQGKIILRIRRIVENEECFYDLKLANLNSTKEAINKKLYEENRKLINDIKRLTDENQKIKLEKQRLQEKIENLEKQIITLKDNFCNKINSYKNNLLHEFKQTPTELKEKINIIETNESNFDVYRSFKDNTEYLVSGNVNTYDIDIINIQNNQLIKSLKGHKNYITTLDYFFNEENQKEYFLSSDFDKFIIVWDINAEVNILHTINTKFRGYICSTLLLFNIKKNGYIVAASWSDKDYCRLYYLNDGSFIKNVYNSNNNTLFLISWINNNQYIIELCYKKIVINSLINDENYAKLKALPEDYHNSGFIYNDNYLCCSSSNGYIRFWNLLTKTLDKTIEIKESWIYGIIQWSDKFIICANHTSNSIIVIDTEIGKVVKSIETTHNKDDGVKLIKKFYHSIYGECLLSGGQEHSIKLWVI